MRYVKSIYTYTVLRFPWPVYQKFILPYFNCENYILGHFLILPHLPWKWWLQCMPKHWEELQHMTCLNSDSHSYKLHFCICLLLLYSLSLTFSTSAIKLQLFDLNFSNYKHTHEHSICNPFCGHDIYVYISIDLNRAGWCGGNTVSVCLGVVWCES